MNNAGNTYTIAGLATGSYAVTVSDVNGCSFVINPILITAPTPIASTATPTPVLCFGGASGTAIVSANGGTAPYNVSWNGPVSGAPAGNEINTAGTNYTIPNLTVGTYSVTITDANGCTQTINAVNITQPQAPLAIAASNIINNLCFGANAGSVTITASNGTAPYQIAWNGTVNGNPAGNEIALSGGNYLIPNLPAGNFTATLTDDNGCTTSTPFVITQPTLIAISNTLTPVLCHGGNTGTATLTISGATAPYNIAWNGPVSGSPIGNEIQNSTGSYLINNLLAGTYSVTITDANGCDSTITLNITQPIAPLALAQSNVNNNPCFGGNIGSVLITASNGTAPYNISWNGPVSGDPVGNEILNSGGNYTVNNLLAGNYTLTLTDANGCSSTSPLSITQPPTAVNIAQSNIVNVLCFGQANGAVTITASNGTAPYNISWNGPVSGDPVGNEILSSGNNYTVNGLVAGNYTVTLTDNLGCNINTNLTITQPANFTVSSSATLVSCFGGNNGTATLSVAGATAPYNIDWNGPVNGNPVGNEILTSGGSYTISNLSAGNYSINITDANGCNTTTSITINQHNPISVITNLSNNLCYNDSTGYINLNVSGGTSGYNISWTGAMNGDPIGLEILNTGGNYQINNLISGPYNITITDANLCDTTFQIILTQPTPLILNTQAIIDNLCNGGVSGSVLVSGNGGTSPYQISWYGPINGSPNGIEIQNSGQNYNIDTLLSGSYTIQIIDFNGCIQNLTAIVNEPSAILVNSNITAVNCFGSNSGSINLNVSGGAVGYNISWTGPVNGDPVGNEISSSGGAYLISNLPTGIYSVDVIDANSCLYQTQMYISQPLPFNIQNVVSNVLCYSDSSGSANLTVNGGTAPFNISWNGPINGNPNGYEVLNIGGNYSISGLIAGNYSANITDANGCDTTIYFQINQPTLLTLNSYNTTPVICAGENNGSINLDVSGGTPNYSVSFNGPQNGSINNQSSIINIPNLVAGNYVVTITDQNSCNTFDSISITQPSQLIIDSIVTSSVLCFGGNTGNAVVYVHGGISGYNIIWTGPSNGNPQGLEINNSPGSYTITGLSYGIYSINLIDLNGCDTSQSILINQPALPLSLSSSVDSVNCFGNNDGSIDLIVSGGTGPFTYLWSNNATTEDLNGITSNNYIVGVTDVNGCSASQNIYVGQPSPLTISANSGNIYCAGDSSGNINISISGGTPNYTFQWSNGSINEDLINIPQGNYLVHVTDANGCIDSALYTIDELMSPLTLISSIQNVSCYNTSTGGIDITVGGGTPAYSYFWSGVNSNTEDLDSLNAGIYTVNILDANGCTFSETFEVLQPNAPLIVNPIIQNAPCYELAGGDVYLDVSGGWGDYTYYWNNLTDTINYVDSLAAGQYIAVVTDTNNCSSTAVINISQPSSPILATSNFLQPSCYGYSNGSINLMISGGNSPYTYLWSNGATQQNLLNITAGQYNVIVSDANGCQIMDTFNLIQPDSLVASFIISDTLGCKPMNTQFINTSIGNYTSAVWSVGNGDVIVAQNSVSYTMNQYGCFDLTLTITSANGCVASSTENSAFCVIPGPTASFYSTTEEIDFYSGLLQLVNNSIGNDNQYQWYFSDGYQSNAENPTHFFPEQTNSIYDIMLIAIDSNGCIDTAIQQYVQQETNVMTVPNSFTAGDDGVNDTFKPVFSLPDLISSYSLEIYNRWGELIFSTNNQYDSWDGKYKGKKCQSGAYTWKIKYTDYLNTTKDAHGHVVLLW